jgi:hypothetical protein
VLAIQNDVMGAIPAQFYKVHRIGAGLFSRQQLERYALPGEPSLDALEADQNLIVRTDLEVFEDIVVRNAGRRREGGDVTIVARLAVKASAPLSPWRSRSADR